MAKTFLQLCQMVARESGTINGVNPPTVVGQNGRLLKVVSWTRDAWERIQNERADWLWMRKEFTGAETTAGAARYTGASWNLPRLGRWITDRGAYLPVTAYLKSAGRIDEAVVRHIGYDQWRTSYGRGVQEQGRPVHYAISPTNEMCLGPVPDDTYVISGEYQKNAQTLAGNDDVPELPGDLHDIIAWRAVTLLDGHDEAPQHLATAYSEFQRLWEVLIRTQLPTIGAGGGALA